MDRPSIWEAIFDRDEKSGDKNSKNQFFTREFSGAITQKLKRVLSSRFFRFTKSAAELISHIPARMYGTALLCFGLLGTILYFAGISRDESIVTPIVSIIISALSIPFLLSDKPLPIFLQDFPPTDYLFFEFFCMKRHSTLENEKKMPVFVPIVLGLATALASVIIPFWQIALAIGAIVCIYIGMESTEFIFLSSLIALPYLHYLPNAELIFGAALVIAMISFIRKVALGRRVLHLEQYDMIIFAMLLFILISGVFVKGTESFSGSVRMIVLALGYTLASNIITNRRLAELSAKSIIFSGTISSIVSVVQMIIVVASTEGAVTQQQLSNILAREDGVVALLMIATVLSLGLIRQSSYRQRSVLVVSAALCIVALIISGEAFAFISVLLCIGAYFIIKSNKLPALFLPLLLTIPVLTLFLPNSLLNVIFKYSPSVVSAEELFDLWSKSVSIFGKNILVGIGIGSESFAQEMANMGVNGYPDSSNLFIEIGLEAGIFALICFILIVFTRLKHRSMQYLYVRNSQIALMSNLSGACLFCFFAFGMVNYIWSDIAAYYLFWCILGIGSATLRVAKKDYDDSVLYYEESSAVDSSVIDIEIG